MGKVYLWDAMLDDRGNAYAVGQISFPVSPRGEFRSVSTRLVKLQFDSVGGFSVSPSKARRKATGRYFSDDEIPLTVSLPRVIGRLLSDTVRFPQRRTPTSFSIDVEGWVRVGKGEKAKRQGLTRWIGTVTLADGDAVRVELSAALRSYPKPEWQTEQTDFYPLDADDPPRITMSFEIDALTRVIRFGGYSDQLQGLPHSSPVVGAPSTLNSMNLGTAPFGFNGSIFGSTDGGQWVRVHEATSDMRYLGIDAPGSEQRLACGLLNTSNRFPRISFTGIDLEVVSSAMRSKRRFDIALTDGDVGDVQYSGSGPDHQAEFRQMTRASLEFELTVNGLVFTYVAEPEGAAALSGKITIPWEVLVVRSPLFGRHRQALQAQ